MKVLPVGVAAGLLLVAAPAAHARPGDLDRTFADTGRYAWNPYGQGGGVLGLALPDDLRPVLNITAARNNTFAPSVVRMTSRGRIAQTTPQATPSTAVLRGHGGYVLAQLDSVQLQLSELGGAPVAMTSPRAMHLQTFGVDGSGRTIAFLNSPFYPNPVAVRFLANGALDTTYGSGGVAPLTDVSNALSVVVKRDSRVFVTDGERLTALTSAGARTPGFAHGALALPSALHGGLTTALAEGPGETLLLAGQKNGNAFLTRLRTTGRIDTRFADLGFNFGVANLRALDPIVMTRDGKGRIVLAGNRVGPRKKAVVLRFSARGRNERAFGTRGRKILTLGTVPNVKVVEWTVSHVAIDKRNRIVLGGNAYDAASGIREDFGRPYPAVARLKG
jgi:hypothetical protein